jgi:rhodanese-related sulfurtransferase
MLKELKLNQQQLPFLALLFMAVIVVALNSRGPNITSINALEAKSLIDTGAIIFDVREKDRFDDRHIEGAISLPLSVLKIAIPLVYENLKSKSIVIYCGDGITKGPVATAILNEAGYTKAVNLKPGIDGWQNAGYKIIK